MSGFERIKDFGRWLREVDTHLGGSKVPRTALGVHDGAPVKLQRAGVAYDVVGPVSAGDAGPIYISNDSTLTTRVQVSPAAAIYGLSAAKIEAAKASPFTLEDGAFSLTPSQNAWTDAGAEWTLVAAPKQRIDEIRALLRDAGAKPGDPFALVEGRAAPFRPARSPRLGAVAALFAVLCAGAAAISVSYGAAAIEAQAQARLSEARKTLTAAEAEAAAAQERRETAAGPLKQAQIVGAALDRAPSVAGLLAALSAATPDDAYLKRLSIRPEVISGEFIAPDAAALAVKIGGDPLFTSARLKGPARAEASTQQRATLDITPGVTR